MRTYAVAAALVVLSVVLLATAVLVAQRPTGPKLYVSAADVAGMMAKAKAERKADQANFSQVLLQSAPVGANLEYRTTVPQSAAVHEKEAEMFYVVDGAATLVTGGKLKDERRTNADNLTGSGIEGGTTQRVAKGDFALVPENTPHWFTNVDGAVTLMSIHVPHAGGGSR